MRTRVGSLSRTGARENNQDSHAVFAEDDVYVVADGMGGLEHGERISAAAVDAVRQRVPRLSERARALAASGNNEARTALFEEIEDLFEKTTTALYKQAEAAGMRMGTTLSVLVLAGNRLVIGHVGDTRVIRVRKGQIKVLTEDHSVAASQLRRGTLSVADYNKSPQRSVLYQSLGTTAEIEPDVIEASLAPGDVLVLCSDGVWASLESDQLIRLASDEDPRIAARNLCDTAIANGSDDNCTAIVVRVAEGAGAGVSLPRALANCRLFRDFKEADLRLLAPYLNPRDLAEGEVIFREGDPGEEMYVVDSGAVEVSRQGYPLTQIPAGVHFGELALAAGNAHTVTARAAMPTRILILQRGALDMLLARRPDLAASVYKAVLADVAARLVDFNDRLGRAERALWTNK